MKPLVRRLPCGLGQRARLAVASVAVLALATLAGCGGSAGSGNGGQTRTGAGGSSKGGLTRIDVGILPSISSAALVLGIKKGYFRQEGLDVHWHTGKGGAALVPAVISGQYQFSYSNNVSLIVAISKGLPVRIVATVEDTGPGSTAKYEALVTSPKSGISSLKQLAGKTIASNTLDNIVTVSGKVALQKAGVDPSSVKFVEVGFPDMPGALKQGRIDAAIIVEPFKTEAKQQGGHIIAHPYQAVASDLYVSSWFTTQSYMTSHPKVVREFAQGMSKANRYASAHPSAVRDIAPSYLKISPSLLGKISLPAYPGDRVSERQLKLLAKYMVRYKVIKSAPDVSKLLPPLGGSSG